MNPDETQQVVLHLSASFRQPLAEDQIVLLVRDLTDQDFTAAMAAVERLRHEDEFMPSYARLLSAIREEDARRRSARELGASATGGCPLCDGGWVEIGSTPIPTVRPCRSCRPVQFERWVENHWLPDHHCDECRDLRMGGQRGVDALKRIRERVKT